MFTLAAESVHALDLEQLRRPEIAFGRPGRACNGCGVKGLIRKRARSVDAHASGLSAPGRRRKAAIILTARRI